MAQQMINHHNYYQQQIQFLRSSGNILLERIKIHETNMNQRKQQNQEPLQQDLNSLNAMTRKLLRLLAEINTCRYFEITYEPFNCYSHYYIQMCNRNFEDLMHQFIAKLNVKRRQRLQSLQSLQRWQSLSQDVIGIIDFKKH